MLDMLISRGTERLDRCLFNTLMPGLQTDVVCLWKMVVSVLTSSEALEIPKDKQT